MWALIIEDNVALREVLAEMLHQVGFEILTAKNGTEAMHFLDGVMPDLITVDIHIPGVSGLTILQRIRQSKGGEFATVVVLSGDLAVNHLEEAELANVFLTKPAGIAELIQLAERLGRSTDATQPSGVDMRRELRAAYPELLSRYEKSPDRPPL